MKELKKRSKILLLPLLAVSVASLAVVCSNTQQTATSSEKGKETINIGYVNWAECVAASNLWQVILEEKGYEVELTQLDVAPVFVGLRKGDIDFFMDAWLPITHEAYWKEYKDDLDDYGVWYQQPAKIGIAVPKYVTIDTIAQLKDEAARFNRQIIGIDPGAGIMKATVRANEDYQLDYKVVQGSEAAMMATLDKAYNKKEWIAITGWSPHWMFAKYDLKYLEDSEKSYGEEEEIHILANKNFSGKQPKIAAMLKKFKMTDAQIGSLEALINDGMDPADAARQWIKDNKETVESWIKL